MSTTIDQRVVEMRFDNSHFEKNTRETMSTLDKLKQKLNLSGAAKGLENINTSANKVNMEGMSNALTTVQSKFSALEVMGVTALANITNSAVNAGKRIVSALTIDPVKTGLEEYETQINAVQTILANTQKEGTNVDIVNAALDELNEYADKTIYNFTEMTRNIGTFTAAGVELDTSVNAIKGIANLAAVSGSTSQQASTAMYQLSQALAAGKVQLMDWNSVVNAGMGGQVFQDALIRTSELLGTGAESAIEMYGSFRESLTKGEWLTTEVLTETLNQLAGAYDEADLLAQGFTKDQADEILKLAQTAEDAATKVKTFTQLWDVMKEAAQSGWAQTWRLIIGDFEEAKALFTPLADFFTGENGIITVMSNARNKLLESALGKSFTGLLDKIKTSANSVKTVVNEVKDYAKVVDEIISGQWGNGQARWDALTEAGYDWAHAQNLVNEKLGNSLRRATSYKETQDEVTESQEQTTEATAEYIVELTKLSDAELKAKGYTDEQIEAFRELAKAADKTGIPLKEFIENIDDIDGRYLLINGFKNLGLSLVSIFKSIGEAWKDAFPPMSSDTLFNIIAGFHKFSTIVRSKVEKNADQLTRTLKGLFAILDMISMVVGGTFKIAFTVLKTILGAFNLNILDFTAMIGDAIVAVRDWIEENNLLTKGIQIAVKFLVKIAKAIGSFVKELWQLPGVQKYVTKITDAFSKLDDISLDNIGSALKKLGKRIKEILSNINKHFNGVPGDIISGLGNGLKDGISKVITFVVELARTIIDKFCEILGIHSPSTVFFAIGGFIIAGLVAGLLSGSTELGPAVEGIVTKIKDFFTNTDWSNIFSKIFSTGMSVGLLLIAKNLTDVIKNFSSVAGGIGDTLSGVGEVLSESAKGVGLVVKNTAKVIKMVGKSFSKVLKGIAFKKTAEGIKELAWSILIIAGTIYLLAQIDVGRMWSAVGAIAVISGVLVALTWGLNKINESAVSFSKDGKKLNANFKTVKTSLLSIGAALLMMTLVVKMMSGMSPDEMKQGFIGLAGVVIALAALLATYGLLIKGKAAQNMDKAGKMMKKMAVTLLLMVAVVKLVSLLSIGEMLKGAAFMAGFVIFVGALVAVTKTAGKNVDKIGKMISKISWALLLMVVVVKLVSLLSVEEMKKGAAFAAGFLIFVAALVGITKIGKEEQIAKIGGMVLAISVAMLLMVGVVKLISMMEWGALAKGAAGIIVLGGIIAGLLYVVKSMGSEAPKLAGTLLAIAVAIGILAAVAVVLSLISIEGLAKGVIAVGLLGGIVALMIKATKGAQDVKGTLIAMAIAIGVMAASIAVLSFIDPTKLLSATVAIGVLMGMFALIESQSKNVTGAWATILAMTAVIVALGVMLIILSKSPTEGALAASISLSVLLLSMAVVVKILSTIGPLASAAYPGMLALGVFIVGLVALLGVIGALVTWIPKAKEFISTGLSIMIQIAQGLGEMIGAFVKGALTQISSALPVIGTNLSLFMMNLMPFIAGAKMIDASVLTGVGILAASIIALSVASLIEGIASFLTFGSSFADLGTQLSMFIMNAMPFIMASKLIDPSMMEGVKTLAEAILILTGANLVEGIASWLTGENSLSKFGEELGGLGTSLNTFATNLGTFDDSKVATVNCACNAIKALAEAASKIPNEGGWAGKIFGENSLATFGDQLPALATSLNGFITNLGTFDEAKIATVRCAGEAITALAEAASKIPNEGGWAGKIFGENSLATFGTKLPALGTQLNQFLTNLGTFDESKVTTVKCAGDAIKTLATAAKSIPAEDGLWQKIVGEKSLASFGEKLPDLAKNIASFVSNLGSFNEGQVTTVNSACNAIKSIAKLGEIDIKDTGKGLKSFGDNMVKFAKKIKSFVDELGDVGSEGITSAINKTKELIEMSKTVANTNIDSIKTFGDSLKKFAKDGVKGFVEAFSGESPKAEAKKAVKAMVEAGIDGADSKKSDVKKAFEAIAKAAADALSSQDIKDKAKSAGKALVEGFASGIDSNTYLATAKAKAMANAAEQAARDALDINSPSRVFRKIGSGVPEGFAQGITMLGSKIKQSISGMSNTAISGTKNAISHIVGAINMDIDSQPTIRPVLDLSEVESGASSLSSMFNSGPSIGVMANLKAISSGVNARNQNGVNDDVVSAIYDLGKTLGNTGGDTYNINGVSVDDDSNVTNAVKTIIRAATVGRRV